MFDRLLSQVGARPGGGRWRVVDLFVLLMGVIALAYALFVVTIG